MGSVKGEGEEGAPVAPGDIPAEQVAAVESVALDETAEAGGDPDASR